VYRIDIMCRRERKGRGEKGDEKMVRAVSLIISIS
jgi:hypothetical protein